MKQNGKITKLTPEQEAKIPEFISKWVAQAAKPTDRKLATQAVKDMYKKMGEDEPIVIFGQSPYSTAVISAIFFSLTKNNKADQLRGQLGDQLYGQLGGQLRGQLRDQLGDQLRGQLGDQLYGQLGGQLRGQLRDQLGDQLGDQLKSINNDWYMNTFWLAWCVWYDYGQYIGVEFDKSTYDLFMAFVSNVGVIIPYKGVAFVSEAPTRIVWDSNRRLSYDHDKAVEYKDGWGLYCLDGVAFKEDEWQKIVNQEFTLEDITKASMGTDKSAIAQKYLRPDRLLEACKAKLIHRGIKGTRLYRVDDFMGTGKTQFCIRMKHPTIEREYIEWVHPDVGSQGDADLCQAAAWVDKDGDPIPLEDYLNCVES